MRKRRNRRGFTLAELLIVVAIIAVLVVIAVPILASQLEKSREAADLDNVRSAYSDVMQQAVSGDTEAEVTVELTQMKDGWSIQTPINVGGVISGDDGGSNGEGTWIGTPEALGSCTITYDADLADAVITWGDGSGSGGGSRITAAGLKNSLTLGILSDEALTKRWRKNANQEIIFKKSDEGDICMNPEPLAVPKGTRITFDPPEYCSYSYYILDAEGQEVLDTSWFYAGSPKATYVVPEDGYKILITAKVRKYDESLGKKVLVPDEEITDEVKQRFVDGVNFELG